MQQEHTGARRLPPLGEIATVVAGLTTRSSLRGLVASGRTAVTGPHFTWEHRSGRPVHLRRNWPEVNQLRQIFLDRAYDFETLPDRVDHVLDLGANIGLSGRWFRERYPAARLVLVEPDAGNLELLRRNFEGDTASVVVNAAIAPRPGTVRLQTTGRQADSFTVGTEGVEVPACTVGELLAEHCPTGTVLIKMDIEGSELDVFAGDTSWLQRVSHLAIELHDRFRPGCSAAFYRATLPHLIAQEVRDENVMVTLGPTSN